MIYLCSYCIYPSFKCVSIFINHDVYVFFPVNLCLRGILYKTIHCCSLVRPETLSLNKGLDCKQSSLGFKHVITTVCPFVIIQHHVAPGTQHSVNHISWPLMVQESKHRHHTCKTDGHSRGDRRGLQTVMVSVLEEMKCIFLNRGLVTHFPFSCVYLCS